MRHPMTPEQLRAACLALTGAVEERPFRDPETTASIVARSAGPRRR
jgi:hypothetical protein